MKNINCKVKCWIKFLFKSVKQKIFQRRILSPTANTQCLNSPLSRLPNTLLTPPPLMRRLPTWSQSLIPLRSPLSLLQGGEGEVEGCNWPSLLRWKQTSCLGTQNRLSVCVCSAAGSKGHSHFRTHKHTHMHRALFTHPPAPNNHCSYLGKVIICSPVCLLPFRALSCQVWE